MRENISPTLTTRTGAYAAGMILVQDEKGKRRITPKEYMRLMGFDDDDYEKQSKVVSSSQVYKQAGNGLISNCVQLIMEHLYKATTDPNYECIDEKMVKDGYGA